MKAVRLGRPPGRPAKENKARNTAFSLTPDIIDKIQKESDKQGISKSEYVRKAVQAFEDK